MDGLYRWDMYFLARCENVKSNRGISKLYHSQTRANSDTPVRAYIIYPVVFHVTASDTAYDVARENVSDLCSVDRWIVRFAAFCSDLNLTTQDQRRLQHYAKRIIPQ